jgi:N-methylhydantoinase B/oxoprolinase/acetone carboxylase alpha subunit
MVAEDVRTGLVSKQTAEQIYGVVIDESTLSPDPSKTQELRLKLRQERTGQPR